MEGYSTKQKMTGSKTARALDEVTQREAAVELLVIAGKTAATKKKSDTHLKDVRGTEERGEIT